MKFFTIDWWRGESEYDPFPEYRTHLEAIRRSLPPDLLALYERVSLHDARLLRLTLDTTARRLDIDLDGDDGQGRLRRLRLHYIDVSLFRSTADPDKGLGGPHGYGDLGYDELDVGGDGFIHRILFSRGVEFEIRFRDFELQFEDIEG